VHGTGSSVTQLKLNIHKLLIKITRLTTSHYKTQKSPTRPFSLNYQSKNLFPNQRKHCYYDNIFQRIIIHVHYIKARLVLGVLVVACKKNSTSAWTSHRIVLANNVTHNCTQARTVICKRFGFMIFQREMEENSHNGISSV
jgi:hypothetical protein